MFVKSIRFRLTLLYSSIFLAGMLGVSAYFYLHIAHVAKWQSRSLLEDSFKKVCSLVTENPDPEPLIDLVLGTDIDLEQDYEFAFLVEKDGEKLIFSESWQSYDFPALADEERSTILANRLVERVVRPDDPNTKYPFWILSRRSFKGPYAGAVVHVAMRLRHAEKMIRSVEQRIYWILAAFFLISSLAGYIMANNAFRPLKRTIRVAKTIDEFNLNRRLSYPKSENELYELAATINNLFDRLERAFVRIQRFSSDASHELRTPLTAMKLEGEIALGGERSPDEYVKVINSMLDEVAKMSRIIDALLTVCRLDNKRRPPDDHFVDLHECIGNICARFAAEAAARGIEISIVNPGGLSFPCDAKSAEMIFGNLVGNAIKYNRVNGAVTIELQEAGDSAVVTVTDTGVGIRRKDLRHVFDRFFRSEEIRQEHAGLGLGLSICQMVVQAMEGRITAHSRHGKGSTFTVALPKRPQAGFREQEIVGDSVEIKPENQKEIRES